VEINGISELEKVTSEGLVVVDFFATWCGPCKMLSPVLEQINEDRSDVKIVKVDIDNNMDLAKKYGIMSVPTVILFKDGKEVDKKIGFMPKDMITEWLNEYK
jgi:thioredoxin 1